MTILAVPFAQVKQFGLKSHRNFARTLKHGHALWNFYNKHRWEARLVFNVQSVIPWLHFPFGNIFRIYRVLHCAWLRIYNINECWARSFFFFFSFFRKILSHQKGLLVETLMATDFANNFRYEMSTFVLFVTFENWPVKETWFVMRIMANRHML